MNKKFRLFVSYYFSQDLLVPMEGDYSYGTDYENRFIFDKIGIDKMLTKYKKLWPHDIFTIKKDYE